MLALQRTRLAALQRGIGVKLRSGLAGPWWKRSFSLLSLLLGFFIGSSLTVHLAESVTYRTFSGLYCLLLCELLVLMRPRWRGLDNLRLGFVYAIVLEAFKVGS
jgi:hypothetical protein